MKSRHVALLLAAAVFAAAVSVTAVNVVTLLLHSSDTFPVEDTAGMEGVEADAATIADHQRYFFFQTMSTVGALLLLVVHGPGALSVDEQDGPCNESRATRRRRGQLHRGASEALLATRVHRRSDQDRVREGGGLRRGTACLRSGA